MSNEPFEITYDDIRTMYLENMRDAEECREVTESTNRGENYYPGDARGSDKMPDFHSAFFKEVLYRDRKTAGFVMEYPHGLVISQGERNSYYRGENRLYPKSQPSLFRTLANFTSQQDQALYKLIADMRIGEFGCFLYQFGISRYWASHYASLLFAPLAQHYGIETDWLDITSDFNVALFFAVCGWDGRKWYPLTKKDTEQSKDAQYGMIFHIPAQNADLTSMASCLDPGDGNVYLNNTILPIGYQPFMRCHSQHAYGIHMEHPFPLQEDITFEKLYFRHNEKLSRTVFDLMDGGKRIYPQEGLNDFEDVITTIKSATTFSDEAFEYALGKNPYWKDRDAARKQLAERQILGVPVLITGSQHPFQVSRQRLRRLDRQYEGFDIEKRLGIKLHCRWCYFPPAKEKRP